MSARGAINGVARPLSSVTDRVRGRWAVLFWCVALCGIVLMCAFEPAAAVGGLRRHFRRQLAVTDKAVQLLTSTIPSTYPLAPTTQSKPVPKRVKCYLFETWPARTYCHILGLTGPIEADQAEKECQAISMDMLSMSTTSEDRLCELMRRFGLEEHKLWLADVFDQKKPHTWEKCKVEVLNATSTRPPLNPSNCTICNIAVVCDAGFYHSNGPSCVTVDEGPEEVEYCYYKDRVIASEAAYGCLEKSAWPLDIWELNDTLLKYVKPLVRTDLEFWVDLREEDVRNLSGVIAFDTTNNDWNTSCVTVWFGRDVPWFFKRNCSDYFPIVCEDTTNKQYYSKNYRFPDCLYHRSHSWMFDYCFPEGHTFDMATGSEFCYNHSMSLLRGSTLDELFYVYTHVHGRPRQDYDRFLIWDARYNGSWSRTSNTCLATLLVDMPVSQHPRSCSQKLGYICKQHKITTSTYSPPTLTPDSCVEGVDWPSSSRPDTCMSLYYMSYEESFLYCRRLGMRLLPDGKSAKEYEEYLHKYQESKQSSLYWLESKYSFSRRCVALQSPGPTIRLMGKDCAERLRVVCLSWNGTTPTTSDVSSKSSLPMSTKAMTTSDNTELSSAIAPSKYVEAPTSEEPQIWTEWIKRRTSTGAPEDNSSHPSALLQTLIIPITTPSEHLTSIQVDPRTRHPTSSTASAVWSTAVPAHQCEYSEGWPRTAAGSIANRPCLQRRDKEMTRKCKMNGQWSKEIDSSRCVSQEFNKCVEKLKSGDWGKIAQGLEGLKGNVQQPDNVRSLPGAIQSILSNFDALIGNLSDAEKANVTLYVTTTVVDLTSAAMNNGRVWALIPQDDRLRTAADLTTKVESFVTKMIQYQPHNTDGYTLGTDKLIITVKPVTEESLGNSTTFGDPSSTAVQLPPNFLPNGAKNASVIFSENSLVKEIFSCPVGPSWKKSLSSRIPVTSFLTASVVVDGNRTASINGNVTLSFDYKCHALKPSCSFIDTMNGSGNDWSSKGCTLVNDTKDKIICSCDHLTIFAILMSPVDIADSDIIPLEWITKIGCGISIVCLIACIIIFSVYRQLRGIRNTIHRNLCLCLLIAEILLLAGMERNDQSRVSCIAVAFCLHYFFLAAFAWMALEGCHIIVLLWKVFNQKRTYYERYYFAGYGIPLIIAGITLACRHEYYAPEKNSMSNSTDAMTLEEEEPKIEFCWLPINKGVRYSFIGPVAAVIALNLGALCLVLWKMSHVRLVVEKSTADKVQNWIRGTLILLPILGVTWLFGFLMLGDMNLRKTGAYLFTIFNCLQGLGIFICHVFMSKKTREAIFRSVVSTGSLVKGSMSSRPSGSGSSSTKTTWYPISLSSNSTSHSSSSSKGIPSTDAQQHSQSFDLESTSCTSLQWWPGTRFRYNLRLNEDGGARPTRSGALLADSDADAQPTLPTFRRIRSIAE